LAAAIRVAALVAVALALANVRGEPDTPVTFLLDVGLPTGTRPPMAVIAGRAHPVLFAPSTTGAGEARTIVPAELAVDVPLEASVVTPRDNLALEALVLLGDESRRIVPEWRDGAAPSVRLRFSPDEVGKRVHAMVIANRLPPPGRRVITLGPAIVQPDTLLVLAYGIEASHCAGHPPVDLGVSGSTPRPPATRGSALASPSKRTSAVPSASASGSARFTRPTATSASSSSGPIHVSSRRGTAAPRPRTSSSYRSTRSVPAT
jgi:hypothetical protein